MFLGAIINTISGVRESFTINSKISEISSQASNLDIYEGLSVYETLEAKNNLILAEYLLATAEKDELKLELWGRVRAMMNENLHSVEKELESEAATKLDIARIIAALQQISGEVDKELAQKNITIGNKAINIETVADRCIGEITSTFDNTKNKMHNFNTELENKTAQANNTFKRNFNKLDGTYKENILSIENLANTCKEKLEESVKETNDIFNTYDIYLAEEEQKISELSSTNELLNEEISKMHNRITDINHEIDTVGKHISDKLKIENYVDSTQLESVISNFDNALNVRINKNASNNTKEIKKLTLYMQEQSTQLKKDINTKVDELKKGIAAQNGTISQNNTELSSAVMSLKSSTNEKLDDIENHINSTTKILKADIANQNIEFNKGITQFTEHFNKCISDFEERTDAMFKLCVKYIDEKIAALSNT